MNGWEELHLFYTKSTNVLIPLVYIPRLGVLVMNCAEVFTISSSHDHRYQSHKNVLYPEITLDYYICRKHAIRNDLMPRSPILNYIEQ
jgi:hypothetical protein